MGFSVKFRNGYGFIIYKVKFKVRYCAEDSGVLLAIGTSSVINKIMREFSDCRRQKNSD